MITSNTAIHTAILSSSASRSYKGSTGGPEDPKEDNKFFRLLKDSWKSAKQVLSKIFK